MERTFREPIKGSVYYLEVKINTEFPVEFFRISSDKYETKTEWLLLKRGVKYPVPELSHNLHVDLFHKYIDLIEKEPSHKDIKPLRTLLLGDNPLINYGVLGYGINQLRKNYDSIEILPPAIAIENKSE